jgi:membrane protein DedA with SNARE-associated domain/rhodanese-related sulfurtransferase
MGVIAHHGYAVVAIVIFLAAVGLPLPTTIVLICSGAVCAQHSLALWVVLPLAWLAAVSGDTLLYFGGRYTGWWLLAWMCRVSLNPEGCIFSSSAYFYRRGAKTLLFAKFVPGLSSMAAPLAGSLNMRFHRFFRLDATGCLLWVSAWVLTGFALHGFVQQIVSFIEGFGHALLIIFLLVIAAYFVTVAIFAIKARKYNRIQRISAASLNERLQTLTPDRLVVIADVRSHGYYDPGMRRIKNSIRVEPTRLKEELVALREFMAPECEIYLYCSCIRDTTSKRVAHMLEQENCQTQVIEGGLKAWIKAGGALELVPESDIQRLPRFD